MGRSQRRHIAIALALSMACGPVRADESAAAPHSVWIIDLGGYGVGEPTYLGSSRYTGSFKPQVDIFELGDREWLTFPNDAIDYSLLETDNFRAGPAGTVTLQSRFHGQDIDLRVGKSDVHLQGGAFAEFYPAGWVRTRVELLQGVTGNTGFAVNLSADYIWRPAAAWTLTIGPRAQIVNDEYASDYFSTQLALKNNQNYVKYRAEGGVLSAGAEITGKYQWTKEIAAKFFVDYNQLMGDAADSPRVNIRGSAEQVVVGVGASYRLAVEP